MHLNAKLAAVIAATFVLASAAPANAQPVTEADFIKALRPKAPDRITGSRSLNDLLGERGVSVEDEEEIPSIDIRVNFALDSIKLENETVLTLRSLGNALSSEDLAGQKILIIGHTDGRGSDEYNDVLSKRRAAAVVSYLIGHSKVNPSLLSSDGHGERDLLRPDDPENDLNRRVEIRNVTGQE